MACTSYLDSKGTGVAKGDQINWVCQYLEGAALEWIQPYQERFFIKKEPVPFLEDTQAFWVEFSKHFVDNDCDEKYRLKWNNLKQTKSVQEYVKGFQQYLVVLDYSDSILRDKFYNGLKKEIKDMMLSTMFNWRNSSAQQVYDKAEEIDNHLEAYKSTTPLHSTSHSSSTSSSTARANTSTTSSNPSSTPQTRLSIGDPVYMIDPTTRRAKKGVIESIGRGPQGNMPNVKWSSESKAVQIPFPSLKKDEKPILNSAPAPAPKHDNKGPGPMDLDGRGIGLRTFFCWSNENAYQDRPLVTKGFVKHLGLEDAVATETYDYTKFKQETKPSLKQRDKHALTMLDMFRSTYESVIQSL
ncbi:hypothetical protein RSOLAG1IB_02040 [Rhizoctonia solani AG-1 IB]|uniref:Retrotransposon gag domain-containing protein n=1 Tax=Thanatephorus cucumeris (strain AG1-IB / isolate 7/3/14) TaxID=1108050 RepID=A0A0B7FDA1_THACB|nr:hypothetical protein RSOLAG1IB_02040 [Rhizoctonia solani AG-1 IB]